MAICLGGSRSWLKEDLEAEARETLQRVRSTLTRDERQRAAVYMARRRQIESVWEPMWRSWME